MLEAPDLTRTESKGLVEVKSQLQDQHGLSRLPRLRWVSHSDGLHVSHACMKINNQET